MPGRHINDHQMRLFMRLRLTEPVTAAAAKAAISVASAYRIQSEARLPSQKSEPRGRRRPDPLADVFDAQVVPMLRAARVSERWRFSRSSRAAIPSCPAGYAARSSGGLARRRCRVCPRALSTRLKLDSLAM